ncbi:cytochrome c oxidase subunit II [Cryomorpha ignava]|uniref:Cytochrome c oxidase subunit 2 n=2 Tax=Cryomorpha ignava TaxID=101383 RepID=A0A7K3WMH2_9FLAO|nr:cytochrome c oxidase subunit II [Cryomorpha ignava]
MNGALLLIFCLVLFAFFIWELISHQDILLPVAASAHGQEVDTLMNFNWIIIFTVFFIVNFLLFFFSYKYAYDPKRKAYYLAHNNKLELIWTVIPSIVLAVIIIYGLRTWNQITNFEGGEDALNVELYGRQFDWTVRYPGDDAVLGDFNFTMITGPNPMGVISNENLPGRIKELQDEIQKSEDDLVNNILPHSQAMEIEEKIGMRRRQLAKVIAYEQSGRDFSASDDDIIVKGEFHIPVNREVRFNIRSSDVIHSAYFPHFRAQMNAVPGMTTYFKFTPTITTDSMRTIVKDPDFNFILLCNKVCGSAHYNMQMDIIVDTEEDYEKWLLDQKTFAATMVSQIEKKPETGKLEEKRIIAEK